MSHLLPHGAGMGALREPTKLQNAHLKLYYAVSYSNISYYTRNYPPVKGSHFRAWAPRPNSRVLPEENAQILVEPRLDLSSAGFYMGWGGLQSDSLYVWLIAG